MRRIFIACSILLFLVYAWASVAYQNMIAVPPPGDAAVDALLDKKYVLRDAIYDPARPDARALYFGGRPLTKDMLDDLRSRGIDTITVTGHAPAVNLQIGTALMIALIFLTLVAALKPRIWDPFVVMLEKRTKQLEAGTEAQRRNQIEAEKFDAEKAGRNADVSREIQTIRLSGQRETAKEANAIVKAAREKEKEVKLAGLRDISLAADGAREKAEKDIPALAEEIAERMLHV